MSARQQTITVVRWIGVLPCALLGGWLAYVIIGLLQWVTLWFGGIFSPDSFGMQFAVETSRSVAAGAALVYLGVIVAPAHRRPVAYCLAALGVLLVGFSLFPSVWQEDGWAIWSLVCSGVGVAGATYYVVNLDDE